MTHELLADALADRYLLDEELGRGSSGTVYLAQDLRHSRRVALKVLHSALGQAPRRVPSFRHIWRRSMY